MNGKFITSVMIRNVDPTFKMRFQYSFPNGCFIPDDIRDKVYRNQEEIISDYHNLKSCLKPIQMNCKVSRNNKDGETDVYDDKGNLIEYSYEYGKCVAKYVYNDTNDCIEHISPYADDITYKLNFYGNELRNIEITYIRKFNPCESCLKDDCFDCDVLDDDCNTAYPTDLLVSTDLMEYLKLSTKQYFKELKK